jgi:hypothetical protein
MRGRADEEAAGIFRDRTGAVLDNTGHGEGCACEHCRWQRSADANTAATPQHESLVVTKVPPPPPPALSVVAGTDAARDVARIAEPLTPEARHVSAPGIRRFPGRTLRSQMPRSLYSAHLYVPDTVRI